MLKHNPVVMDCACKGEGGVMDYHEMELFQEGESIYQGELCVKQNKRQHNLELD